MKKLMNRVGKAAQFYAGEYKRESKKELQVLRGVAGAKPMISYMGWTGHNNLGDEILYDAHVALFPRMNVVPFRRSGLLQTVETVRRKPLYVAGFLGGGTLINQSDSWLKRIAFLQAKQLPIYCLGTGVTESNFRAKHERTTMQEWVAALKTFKFVGIRGPYSAKQLTEAGFADFTVTGDTALALAKPTYAARKNSKVIGLNYGLIKENLIWGDADEYTQNMAALIKRLIAEGYSVKLLPVWDKDIASNRALLKLVDDPKCTMTLAFDTLESYQRELAECRLFIGQKLHATIMACMDRIPSIMIEYNPKCRDFMASVNMEQFVLKTSECTPDIVLATVSKLDQHYDNVQKELDERIMHYRTLQFETAKKIEDELLVLGSNR